MNIKKIDELAKYSKKFHLLYVEDDDAVRKSMVEILELFFDSIEVAIDGEMGLEKFLSFENKKNVKAIDLIITDINMPNMNGLEMLQKIRETNKNIDVIILSAHNESDYFINSIRLGINNFILKPVIIDDLLVVIQNVFEKIILANDAKENLQLLSEYQEAIDHSSIVSRIDLEGNITYVNDAFCKISQYTKEEIIGQHISITQHPDTSDAIYDEMWITIKDKKEIWKSKTKNISKDSASYYVYTTIKPIIDIDGDILEYIILCNDITQLVSLNDKINKLHTYDVQQQHFASEKIDVGIVNDMSEDEAQIVFLPLDILSGDFYSLYKPKDDLTFMYIIDGQGHGISPALTVFATSSIINNKINDVSTLSELTDAIFPMIKAFLRDEEQLSYIMIMIDDTKKTLSYCSGGMYPFFTKDNDEITSNKTNNLPFMNFSDNPEITTVELEKLNSVLLYSDGFVEHTDVDIALYSPLSIITKPSLLDETRTKLKESELDDDVTIIYYDNLAKGGNT